MTGCAVERAYEDDEDEAKARMECVDGELTGDSQLKWRRWRC